MLVEDFLYRSCIFLTGSSMALEESSSFSVSFPKVSFSRASVVVLLMKSISVDELSKSKIAEMNALATKKGSVDSSWMNA